jgi:pilus assembly protein Flp/PilA
MIKKLIINFFKDDEGATMIEYALMLALIAIVCFAVVTGLGLSTNTVFDTMNSGLATAS